MNYFIRKGIVTFLSDRQIAKGRAEGCEALTGDELEKHLSGKYEYRDGGFHSTVAEATQVAAAKDTCQRRILSKYSYTDQLNIASGVTSDPEGAYPEWVRTCLSDFEAIKTRDDLTDIDVTSGEYWTGGDL